MDFHRVQEHPKGSPNEGVMQVVSREENQQLAAPTAAAAATVKDSFSDLL